MTKKLSALMLVFLIAVVPYLAAQSKPTVIQPTDKKCSIGFRELTLGSPDADLSVLLLTIPGAKPQTLFLDTWVNSQDDRNMANAPGTYTMGGQPANLLYLGFQRNPLTVAITVEPQGDALAVIRREGDNGKMMSAADNQVDYQPMVMELYRIKLPKGAQIQTKALEQDPAPGWERLLQNQKPTMNGDDVLFLQALLTGRFGYDCGGVDAWFGAKTAAAVKKIQARLGLPATGSVGEDDWRKIIQAAIQ